MSGISGFIILNELGIYCRYCHKYSDWLWMFGSGCIGKFFPNLVSTVILKLINIYSILL